MFRTKSAFKGTGMLISAAALAITIIAPMLFSSTALATNQVYIDVVHADDPLQPVDTLYIGGEYCFRIWIENYALLGGVSTPYLTTVNGDATFSWVAADGFNVVGGDIRFLTGIPGSRWMSGAAADGSCWDLGGTCVSEGLYGNNVYFGVGGAALSAGLAQGPLQPMLEAHFRPYGIWSDGVSGAICIDSFRPPPGDFIFVPGGTPAFSCQGCWPVKVVCGDANGNGDVDMFDVVLMVNYVFKGGPPPDPWQLGDANADGVLNLADVMYLLYAAMRSGPQPVCPENPPMKGD
jgi:hypothetical protein